MNKIDKIVNTFSGGLNRDTIPSHTKPDEYYDALNVRVLVDEEGSSLSLTNINGGSIKISLPSNQLIKGTCFIRNRMIIFAVGGTTDAYIYSFIDDGSNSSQTLTSFSSGTIPNTAHFKQIYTDYSFTNKLGFNTALNVNSIGRYETDSIEKVYFNVDGGDVKILNIKSDYTILSTLDPSTLSMLPSNTIPTLNSFDYIGGNIPSGVRHYCVQYYNQFLNETEVSPLSLPISISSTISGSDSTTIKGSKLGDNTGIGLKLTYTNLDVKYNFIKVIAVHYKDMINPPDVTIVYDGSYSGTSLIINDTGSVVQSLSIEDVTFGLKLQLSPKTIETKDNTLFYANSTISDFSTVFDTRAYRFKSVYDGIGETYTITEAKIYDVNGDYYVITNDTNKSWKKYTSLDVEIITGLDNTTWTTIPSTADCIIKEEDLDVYVYTPHSGVVTSYSTLVTYIGSEGPNVKITLGEDNTTTLMVSQVPVKRNKDDYSTGKKRIFQRDELYRFALNIKNSKGQNDYAKWICDFKMPRYDQLSSTGLNYLQGSTDCTATVFYPIVTITNLPSTYNAQVLYHKRDSVNRSILGQGLAIPLHLTGSTYRNRYSFNFGDTNYVYSDFISPEPIINGTFTTNTNTKVRPLAYLKGTEHLIVDGIGGYFSKELTFNPTTIALSENDLTVSKSKYSKVDLINFGETSDYIDSNYPISKVLVDNAGTVISRSGSCVYTKTNAVIPQYTSVGLFYGTLVNYTRSVSGMYGGNSYTARQLNQNYIVASDNALSSGSPITLNCFYGDTFLTYFNYLRGILVHYDDSAITENVGVYQIAYNIPVETTINLDLLINGSLSNRLNASNLFIREEPHADYSDLTSSLMFKQDYTLYEYNSAYSRAQDTQKYVVKPINYVSQNTFDTRVYNSEKKFNGEYVDSWTKVKVFNRLDVDSKYGEIVRLLNHNNLLLFFQNEGFGILAVNQRSLIKDNNINTLSLGTGGVLEKYDMLSTNYGVLTYNAVCNSDNTIYFYDALNKKVIKFTNDEEELSVIGKVNSIFKQMSTSDTVYLSYNQKYKEIFINLIGTNFNKTLVYSEYLNSFIGWFSFYSNLYENYGNTLYIKNKTTEYEIYKLDTEESNYQIFGGNLTEPYIELISTTGMDQAIWDNTSFNLFIVAKYDRIFTGTALTVAVGEKILYDYNNILYQNKIYKNTTVAPVSLTTSSNTLTLFSDKYGNIVQDVVTVDYRNTYQAITGRIGKKKYRDHNFSIIKDSNNRRMIDNVLFTKLNFITPVNNYVRFKLQDVSTYLRKLIQMR